MSSTIPGTSDLPNAHRYRVPVGIPIVTFSSCRYLPGTSSSIDTRTTEPYKIYEIFPGTTASVTEKIQDTHTMYRYLYAGSRNKIASTGVPTVSGTHNL